MAPGAGGFVGPATFIAAIASPFGAVVLRHLLSAGSPDTEVATATPGQSCPPCPSCPPCDCGEGGLGSWALCTAAILCVLAGFGAACLFALGAAFYSGIGVSAVVAALAGSATAGAARASSHRASADTPVIRPYLRDGALAGDSPPISSQDW